MAVVYFTNNASTGAGSLVAAILSAAAGDVIRPDETVFERGSTIEIVLASTLTIGKTLTLDGGPYRVRLNGDGRSRCVALSDNASVEITSFDIVGGGWNSQTSADVGNAAGAGLYVPGGSAITLNRCGFYACRGTYGGGFAVGSGATATLNDCVVTGCYARGSGAGIRSLGDVAVYGSTIVGNVAADTTIAHDILVDGSGTGRVTLVNSIVGGYRGNVEIGDGCVVGVALSQVGFVVAPPDDFSADTWTADAWQSWDLRLLDDASPNPSPFRDSGDVDAASTYDFDGAFRGRETNGVATCSPGAYETIQADLFWGGFDGASPSFAASNGWAASRFATASGTVAPSAGDRLFVGVSATFNDAAPLNAYVVIGASPVTIETNSGSLETPIGCNVSYSGTLDSMKLASWTKISNGAGSDLPPIVGGENLVFSGVSVSVLDGVIFSAVASPSGLTPVNGGGWADVTAGVTSVSATALNESVVEVTIEKSSPDKTAFAQYSVDDGVTWENIATSSNVDVYELSIPAGSFAIIRAAIDGGWLTAIASTAEFTPVWTVSAAAESIVGVVNAFEISTGGSNTGNNSYNLSGWGTL